ncbi:hypothetical protein CRUP_020544 [Coryphaenoides rupestris]|nr:hypothetical protein CRUP_020544 [Coryphaenoides rupestris]
MWWPYGTTVTNEEELSFVLEPLLPKKLHSKTRLLLCRARPASPAAEDHPETASIDSGIVQ